MTILLLCNGFPPAIDGVGDYTYRLASVLAEHELAVHVVCRAGEPVRNAAFTVHPVINKWGLQSTSQVLEIIRQIQPDWVGLQYVPYAFQQRGLPFFLPGLLRRIRQSGVQVWITFHEVHIRLQGFKGAVIGALQRHIARNLCGQAQVCVTSIEFYRNLLHTFHPDIRVIPVGANVEATALSATERRELRNRLFSGKKFIVSTFGLRRQAELLRAVESLSARGVSVGLLICGQSAFFEQKKSHPLVQATGYLPAPEIARHLQCSDLFVLPDYVSARGAGGACLKSGSLASGYAAGLPVVGVRGDMTGKPLVRGKNIWLAENDNAEQLAAAMEQVLCNTERAITLQSGGQTLFREQLCWPSIGRRYMEFIQGKENVETDS